ncbi:MAG: hypothetical protein ACPHCX_05250, partial [Candidatus Puniceispirillaceae bacterium]
KRFTETNVRSVLKVVYHDHRKKGISDTHKSHFYSLFATFYMPDKIRGVIIPSPASNRQQQSQP